METPAPLVLPDGRAAVREEWRGGGDGAEGVGFDLGFGDPGGAGQAGHVDLVVEVAGAGAGGLSAIEDPSGLIISAV
ncbi:hypothetical protein [Dactylosporangium salmoneum]|uniref:Uncharacterized protein n=1 Tax=Dactylosporangium salmoneum TaxID=53361 RepID=A0ABP5TVD4_9ACTN